MGVVPIRKMWRGSSWVEWVSEVFLTQNLNGLSTTWRESRESFSLFKQIRYESWEGIWSSSRITCIHSHHKFSTGLFLVVTYNILVSLSGNYEHQPPLMTNNCRTATEWRMIMMMWWRMERSFCPPKRLRQTRIYIPTSSNAFAERKHKPGKTCILLALVLGYVKE